MTSALRATTARPAVLAVLTLAVALGASGVAYALATPTPRRTGVSPATIAGCATVARIGARDPAWTSAALARGPVLAAAGGTDDSAVVYQGRGEALFCVDGLSGGFETPPRSRGVQVVLTVLDGSRRGEWVLLWRAPDVARLGVVGGNGPVERSPIGGGFQAVYVPVNLTRAFTTDRAVVVAELVGLDRVDNVVGTAPVVQCGRTGDTWGPC